MNPYRAGPGGHGPAAKPTTKPMSIMYRSIWGAIDDIRKLYLVMQIGDQKFFGVLAPGALERALVVTRLAGRLDANRPHRLAALGAGSNRHWRQ